MGDVCSSFLYIWWKIKIGIKFWLKLKKKKLMILKIGNYKGYVLISWLVSFVNDSIYI